MLYLVAVPAAVSILMIQDPTRSVLVAVGILDLVILLLAMIDMIAIVKSGSFTCERNMLRIASQSKKHEVEIELINRSTKSCFVAVQDDLPSSFEANPKEFETRIDGKSKTQFSYDFVSDSRGQSLLECVHLLVASPLNLWHGFLSSSLRIYDRRLSGYEADC